MAPTRGAFKALPGKFSSAQWRTANAARVRMDRQRAFAARRQVRRSGYALARRIAINRERKYLDTVVTSLPFDSDNAATSTTALNIIAQGDTVNQRVGKKVALKAVQIKGAIYAGDQSNDHAVLLLVYDRNPNQQAALPLPNDVLSSSNGGSCLTNRDWSERFKIIRRWDYAVVGQGSPAASNNAAGYPAGGSVIPVDEYVPLKGRETEWNASNTNGAVASMVKGSLFLLAMGDTPNGTTTPLFTGTCRVDFDD